MLPSDEVVSSLKNLRKIATLKSSLLYIVIAGAGGDDGEIFTKWLETLSKMRSLFV